MMLNAYPHALDLTAKLFHGFADHSRLAILVALKEKAMTVGELVATTGLSQSNTSNHLACLRDCGLVTSEQEGRFTRYAVSDERVRTLLSLADELLADFAQGIYECTRYANASRKEDSAS